MSESTITSTASTIDLRGVVPPLLTPLAADGSIDLAGLDRLIDHLLSAGVDGIFPLGSSGQVAYLTDAERDLVVSRTVERVGGKIPVVVGVPDFTARRVAEHGRRAAELGADAIVATAPLYALQSPEEIADSFRSISSLVDVPLIAYDVPVRVGVKLPEAMLIELGTEGTICAVKDSSGNDVAFRRLVNDNVDAGSPLQILTGHEAVVDGMLLLGADGVVPGLGNVDPAGYVRLYRAARSGDWDTARAEQDRLNRLFEIAFLPQGYGGDAAGIGAFKHACAQLGIFDSPTMPAPLRPLDDESVAGIGRILGETGLL